MSQVHHLTLPPALLRFETPDEDLHHVLEELLHPKATLAGPAHLSR